MKNIVFAVVLGLTGMAAMAKIPAPVLDDAGKAKAAEAAAKTAWAGKLDAFQLCKAQDRVAAHATKTAKANGKEIKPAKETPACADPGAFVSAPVSAPTAPAPAAPAKKS